MSIGDIVVLLLIAGLAALAFFSAKKRGSSGCTGGCASCSRACAWKNRESRQK